MKPAHRSFSPLLAAAAAAFAALCAPAPVSAQMGPGIGGLGMGGASQMRPPEEQRRRAPPPGLPGLTARPGAQPIPAETDPQGLSPNDALFDGISRGDIQTVRDAVNRGADVNARNALGLTALDAAVDQGRPEITFYLLSVRGAAGSAPPPPGAGGPALSGRGGRDTTRSAPSPRGAAPSQPLRPDPTEPPTAASRLPVLWAGNGGSPRPEIGFLGFDAGQPAGAERRGAASARRG